MQLILIRHGEPHTAAGPAPDPPLSPLGRAQAADLAGWLAGETITAVYCSPLRRARETAGFLSAELPLAAREVRPVEGLAEFGGTGEYVPVDELRRTGDPRWAAMAAGELAVFGTDLASFRSAVTAAFDPIVAAHPGETVAAVCHAGVINAFLGSILGIERLLWCELDYAGLSRLAVSRSGVRSILSLNERPHGCGRPASHRSELLSWPTGS